eukprot:3275522-Rhodomonas_salina.1
MDLSSAADAGAGRLSSRAQPLGSWYANCLRVCYGVPGTDLAYGATRHTGLPGQRARAVGVPASPADAQGPAGAAGMPPLMLASAPFMEATLPFMDAILPLM